MSIILWKLLWTDQAESEWKIRPTKEDNSEKPASLP